MRHILIGYAIASFGTFGVAAWTGAFLVRVHELTLTEIGTLLGFVVGASAFAGTLMSATLGPLLVRQDRRWELGWPALAYGIAIPLYIVAFLTESLVLMLVLFSIVNVVAYSCVGLLLSSVQTVLPADARAMGIALIMFAGGLIGAGAGPLLVGYLP